MYTKVSAVLLCVIIIAGFYCDKSVRNPASKNDKPVDFLPCNPNASTTAKAVLKYLANLSSVKNKKAIAGQNCYHGDEIIDGYTKLIVRLQKETGKWVGMLGVDYEFMDIYSAKRLSRTNRILSDYWTKGGLITIVFSPQNPWVNNETGRIKKPEPWNGPGSPVDCSQADLDDLLDSSKPVYKGWRKKLDRIAAGLAELQKAGVVVLWRPMQEMNGNWFWWGNDPGAYIKVYRDMFAYFTYVKKLNNLLWVYSPQGLLKENGAYPGDQYVDIIAPTCYSDKLEMDDDAYYRYSSMGKPMGFAEYGPQTGGRKANNGTLDTVEFINTIRKKYPRMAYWVCWHSYPGVHWSIISNKNYNTLMHDQDVITLDRLKWK